MFEKDIIVENNYIFDNKKDFLICLKKNVENYERIINKTLIDISIETLESMLSTLEFEPIFMNINVDHYSAIKESPTEEVKKPKNIYNYKCNTTNCNGFLNENFLCIICNSNYCKECFILKTESHICNQSDLDNFNLIKKISKPCPGCGECIHKIEGCDQMFCTSCGTCFSWDKGIIDKGVIHNPHAYDFFKSNKKALDLYNERLNQNDNCGMNIYTRETMRKIEKELPENIKKQVRTLLSSYQDIITFLLNSNTEIMKDFDIDESEKILFILNKKKEKSLMQYINFYVEKYIENYELHNENKIVGEIFKIGAEVIFDIISKDIINIEVIEQIIDNLKIAFSKTKNKIKSKTYFLGLFYCTFDNFYIPEDTEIKKIIDCNIS